jgi:hypothetical protein
MKRCEPVRVREVRICPISQCAVHLNDVTHMSCILKALAKLSCRTHCKVMNAFGCHSPQSECWRLAEEVLKKTTVVL